MAKAKKVSTYYGGDLTARQKATHEKRLADIYSAAIASNSPLHNAVVPDLYRDFVAFCGRQRKPYIAGTERADARLLSAIGGAGERGEVCNIIKKLMFREKVGKRRLNARQREMLISEVGDDLWYFMLVLIAFDLDLNEVMLHNMNKLVQRGR